MGVGKLLQEIKRFEWNIFISMDPIVQYIVLRGDLKFPKGALCTQVAHASVSAIHTFQNDETTIKYLDDLKNMHKIVLKAENLQTLE